MENAIISLLVLAVLVSGVLILVGGSFNSVDVLSQSWKEMEGTSNEIMRTSINDIGYEVWDSGKRLNVTLENDGGVALRDFDQWGVTVEYYKNANDYRIEWFSYDESYLPGGSQWAVKGIYLVAESDPEVFEPGIFNPGEEMVVSMRFAPFVGTGTTNRVTIATANGVTTSAQFQR
jgi:hypothetical protein